MPGNYGSRGKLVILEEKMYTFVIIWLLAPKGLQVRDNEVSVLIVGGATPFGRKIAPRASFVDSTVICMRKYLSTRIFNIKFGIKKVLYIIKLILIQLLQSRLKIGQSNSNNALFRRKYFQAKNNENKT